MRRIRSSCLLLSALWLGSSAAGASADCLPEFTREFDWIPLIDTLGPVPNPWMGGWTDPRPQLLDADADGDLDLFVAEAGGRLRYYRNDGSSATPDFSFVTDDFAGVHELYFTRLADLDADGDLDLLVEAPEFETIDGGNIVFRTGAYLYTNTGTAQAPVYQNLSTHVDGYFTDENGDPIPVQLTSPDFVDLEGDGDPDLLMGRISGDIILYRNVGTLTAPSFRFETDSYRSIQIITGNCIPSRTPPAPRHGFMLFSFFDVDGDGDPDLFVGDQNINNSYFYENLGQTPDPDFACITDTYYPGDGGGEGSFDIKVTSTFGDLDGDGDPDALFGPGTSVLSGLYYYRNDGDAQNPAHVQVSDDYLPEFDRGSKSAAAFADVDGDGDLDLFFGSGFFQTLTHFENVGSPTAPMFAQVSEFALGSTSWASPELGDIDDDGDLDLFVGVTGGAIRFWRNDAVGPGPPAFVEILDDADFGPSSSQLFRSIIDEEPTARFFDEDGDGDLDVLAGNYAFDEGASLLFFRNDGSSAAHDYVLASTDYQGLGDVRFLIVPAIGDLDEDGDPDLLIGGHSGTLRFARNVGSPGAPEFVIAAEELGGIDVGVDAVPALADLDNDGDLDLVIGESGGGLNLYRNTSVAGAAPSAFALVWPLEDARLEAGATARFTWEASLDPETNEEADYELRFVASPASPPEAWYTIANLASHDVEIVLGQLGFEVDAPFYWTVAAANRCGTAPVPEWRRAYLVPAGAPPQLRFSIDAVYPSPAFGASRVTYSVPREGTAEITIHDLTGRRVRRLFRGDRAAGAHEVAWDGTTDAGTVVAAGVYLVRVEFQGRVASRRVVRLR